MQGNLSLCEGENVIPYLALLCIFFCKHKTGAGSKKWLCWGSCRVTAQVEQRGADNQGRPCSAAAPGSCPHQALPRAGVTECPGSVAARAGANGVLHMGTDPKPPRATACGDSLGCPGRVQVLGDSALSSPPSLCSGTS